MFRVRMLAIVQGHRYREGICGGIPDELGEKAYKTCGTGIPSS
jgi:hypothetical protein